MLTGWQVATDGKSTLFDKVCKALGVEFDLSRSGERLLAIRNTEQRIQDLKAMVASTLKSGHLGKNEALMLRGKLGFADSFLHGRLGALVLKQLSEHAYGRSPKLQKELILALQMMVLRLESSKPRMVSAEPLAQWFVYTDAAYDQESKTGGLGAYVVAGLDFR